MGIGSLARYRRYIMLLGGILFLGGALLRWHSGRQVDALGKMTAPMGATTKASWRDECKIYACRVIAAKGPECDAICGDAVVSGDPGVPAERIAHACKNDCVAQNPDDASCPGQCLIREAIRSAAAR